MKALKPAGPRWPFNVAMAGFLLVGSICLMPAILSLWDSDWIGLLVALLAMAFHFVLAVLIYQRKLWAVITAFSLYSLALLGYTFVLGFLILMLFRRGRLHLDDSFEAIAIVTGIDAVLAFFVFCLFRCIRIILHSRRESVRGFDVLQTVLPVEEIVEPEEDPFDNIQ